MSRPLDWLKRPFAHRGLHDRASGVIENTASAVLAAVSRDYGIEVDLRLAACGTVMVFHDADLARLTHGTGLVAMRSRAELQMIPFRHTSDRMLTLADLLALADARVPLLLEIKSDAARDDRIVTAVIEAMRFYRGNFAVMSFDPFIISAFRRLAPVMPRGLVAERFSNRQHWPQLSWSERLSRRFLLSTPDTRPDFIAYDVDALPALAPCIARRLFHRPLLTWTVRSRNQRERASRYADAMIFEALFP